MRRALVVGGSSGIGRACVDQLLADDYEVVSGSRTREGTPAGATWTPTDVTHESVEEHLRKTVPPELDLVVYAAGFFPERRSVATASFDDWRQTLDTNLTGAFRVARATLPALAARRGTAVFIGSVYGRGGLRLGAAYAAAKHGLLGLADSINQEFEIHAVRAAVISPGIVATPMAGGSADLGLPAREIARAVQFLASMDGRALVRELVVERVQMARRDREMQETAPPWAHDVISRDPG